MYKTFNAPLSTFELFQSGALIYGNFLLTSGQSDEEALASLQSRYPMQDILDLQYVLELTHQGQQAASELADLPPGFWNPPSGIPIVPGVEKGGYIIDAVIGHDEDGNDMTIRRKIESDEPLTYDELVAVASEQLAEIMKNYREDFEKRDITFSQLTDIEAQLAWFKG